MHGEHKRRHGISISKRRPQCGILTAMVAATVFACTAPQLQAAQPGPSIESFRALKEKAAALLHSDAVTVAEPTFRVRHGTVSFYPGRVFLKTSKEPDLASSALRAPLELQLQLELLREYLAAPPRSMLGFWTRYLDQAERSVEQLFLDVQNGALSSTPTATIDQRRAEVQDALLQGLQVYAKDHDLRVVESRESRGKVIAVTFVSDPPGAQIKIARGFFFAAAHGNLDESQWLDVSGGNTTDMLAGDWQVKRRWSSNEPWIFGLESITRSGPFTIKQPPP
jgi:hypothetical protein